MKKAKKRVRALLIVPAAVVALLVATVQFTPFGYRLTAPLRGFSRVAPNVYVHNQYSGSKEEVLSIVNGANARVAAFFGELRSNPMVIICDDACTLKKLGGDHDTKTIVIGKAYSYISLSSQYLNADVLAHELTHAETHARLYKGKLRFDLLVPTWFDEGVALQNDCRELYSEDAWKATTNDGANMVELSKIDTPAEFYAGSVDERRYRYVVSKHELREWLSQHGVDALLMLLDRINGGESFKELYAVPSRPAQGDMAVFLLREVCV